ncbi:hypothetical protein J2755_000516 [Methanohalophilus levihalophilus]|uniref:DUF7408 domain-containing protein n=1 Tax=Methanohalophilus levihalophilus TaxID=1431282 RepID=UPI001AE28070|nr:VWA domain-containing protein [Methanohalophilus levihalophilus]MBP2029596.1 hypothetical protein [Methanohalophilus levihalophilus]
MAFEFGTPLALAALASLIPLIILYLLRPKPLVIKIPSLMFLMRVEQKKRFSSIRKLFRDPIFLIQLLVLILLSTAAASPFLTSEEDLSGEHTVIIIDSSASMQVDGRFSEATRLAEGYVSKENTIILAKNIPEIVLQEGNSGDAKSQLDEVEATSTVADLSAAISEAMRILSERGGRIVVLSDFGSWDGNDPVESKQLAESYGLDVAFIPVGSPADNIGIIDGWIEQTANGYEYNCIIKNYDSSRKTVNVDIQAGDYSDRVSLSIQGRDTEAFKLSNLGTGITEISISNQDSFDADNKAYVSIPTTSVIPCLIITDTQKLPSSLALSLLPGAELSTSTGVPSVSDLNNYRVVVVSSKDIAFTAEEVTRLSTFLNSEGNVVFVASESLDPAVSDNVQKLLPVEITEIDEDQRGTEVEVTQETRLTDDIKYEEISLYTYLNSTLKEDAVAVVTTEDDIPMLAYMEKGDGIVLYIGFNDRLEEPVWNNFHNLPEYPVMWARILAWLGGAGDIGDYNLETGTVTPLTGERNVLTPSGTVTTNRVYFEETGIYEIGSNSIAVNLYSDPESDTTVDPDELVERSMTTDEPRVVRETTYTSENHLEDYLIAIVILLAIIEILIIRKRGEL